MKKSFFIFLLFISTSVVANNASSRIYRQTSAPDTTVLDSILSLNLNHFIGKPVDSLFSVLPAGYTSRGFMPTGIGYAKGVYQSYGSLADNNCSVEIFIDTFQFMTFPNRTKTTTWSMNLAKQETISFIRVLMNNVCIYGCSNPNYYD